MILVIFGICVVLMIAGVWLGSGYGTCSDLGDILAATFGVGVLVTLVAAIVLMISVVNKSTIDERIVMYQEENARIEEQIDTLVKDYQSYESGVFASTKTESAITLVALYPELKADQLVSSQLDIYVKNNEQIKRLRLEQINADVVRWWLYFGGK